MTNLDLLFQLFGIILTIFAVGITGAILYNRRNIKNTLSNTTNEVLTYMSNLDRFTAVQAGMSNNRGMSEIEQYFVKDTASIQRKMFTVQNSYALYEALMSKLGAAFDSVEIYVGYLSEYGESIVLKVLNGETGIAFIKLNVEYSNAFWEHKDIQPNFTSPHYNLDNYYIPQQDKIILPCVTNDVTIVIPTEFNDIKVDILQDILKSTELTKVQYKSQYHNTSAYIYEICTNQFGQWELRRSRLDSNNLDFSNPDVFYSDTNFTYRGRTKEVTPTSLIEALTLACTHRENIQLYGKFGTGKTNIARHIAALMSRKERVRVIKLSTAILKELDTQKGSSELSRLLYEDTQTMRELVGEEYVPYHNIFFIDEAESALVQEGNTHSKENSFLLKLMDGLERDSLNASVIMTLNADPSVLNPALYRAGRKGLVVEMKPITAVKAIKLKDYLIKKYDNTKVFDQEAFNTCINEDSTSPNGKIYAPKGFTTVADVMNLCFVPKDYSDLLSEILFGEPRVEASASKIEPKVTPTHNLKAPKEAPQPTESTTHKPKGDLSRSQRRALGKKKGAST